MYNSRDAFAELHDKYSGAIYGTICKMISNTNIAEELLQDVFVKVWKNIDNMINQKDRSLEQYALDSNFYPPTHLKNKILVLLDNLQLEEKAKLDELPLLNKYSDHNKWLQGWRL